MVDRFGEAIEWDLRERLGVDLLDYFRGVRPWAQLARFLDGLQRIRTSRFVTAQNEDAELALVAARRRRENASRAVPVRYRPPAIEWDSSAELLASILDRLGEALALLADLPIAGKKRKHKPPKRTARPRTAIERAEQQLAEEHVADIMADVEAGYVTVEEYARIEAEVEAARRAGTAAV